MTLHAKAAEPPSSSTSTTKAHSTRTAIACRRSSRNTPTTSPFPIFLTYDKSDWDAEKKESTKTRTTEQVNAASAMWRRAKSELVDDDYKELYKSISHDWEDPLFWFHTRAEGTLEYTTLFYIPAKAPLDLYQMDYKGGVKLYVKRVFIMDDSKELLPAIPALRPRRYRLRGPSAKRLARDPAAEQYPHHHQDGQRQKDSL